MKKQFLFIILIIFFLPVFTEAQDILSPKTAFNIEPSYDISKRDHLNGLLIKTSPRAYWYADSAWWEELGADQKKITEEFLSALTLEFEDNIYPKLTKTFGYEWTPGIDKDTRITILIHPMKKESGGYTNSADEYPKIQVPKSNEREMIYLNSQYINNAIAKVFLAHELVHLITLNQKDRISGLSEDVWLNEARADYSSTFLGYDKEYEGSNLQRRVEDFMGRPSDSLTEWRETPADYGVVNLFTQYLVDHYGISILADSIKLPKSGIDSLNAVLTQQGFKENFSQIFINWTVAVLINDCQISEKYCYYNQNLKNFRIIPLLNYLPLIGNSTLSVSNATKDWTGNWHKFLGGMGALKLQFASVNRSDFKVPYVTEDYQGNIVVGNLVIDENKQGEIILEDFGSKIISLTIIPVTQVKISNFSNSESSQTFFWSASTQKREEPVIPAIPSLPKPISQMTREEIISKISEIKNLIIQLQAQLAALAGSGFSCQSIAQNLYFGMSNNLQVKCLQEFLKSQGPEIYPEGIVNGNFYALTQKAVISFQEKYSSEILTPVNEVRGTGYVGPSTRAKINSLLTK